MNNQVRIPIRSCTQCHHLRTVVAPPNQRKDPAAFDTLEKVCNKVDTQIMSAIEWEPITDSNLNDAG